MNRCTRCVFSMIAFFVTFRQFDPLFAVDLSDPTNPVLMGELHIPGYSEYLQPIDDTHLLAIGRDTTFWGGSVEEPGELQISIFDISDLSNPQLADRYSFGGGYTTVTPATGSGFLRSGDGDHHAVSYFADEQILALPIHTLNDYASWWVTAENQPLFAAGHGGLQVFKIDVDSGFTPIGLIEHDTLIERSVRIGDRLFAISSGTLSEHNLADPTVRLGDINIGASAAIQPVELKMYQAVTEDPVERLLETQTYVPVDVPNDAPHESPVAEVNVGAAAATSTQAGWVVPSLELSRHTQPARVAAFSRFPVSRRFDNELLQLLSADTASEGTASDLFIHDDHLVGTDSDESCERGDPRNHRFLELASTLAPSALVGQDRI